jgi:predicted aminopeptidase
MTRRSFVFALVAPLLLLGACEDSLPSYLIRQGLQQGALYMGARPVEDVIKDPASDPRVRQYLQLSREVLRFASTQLGMKTNGNYRSYAALKSRYVSYVVVAAEQDRLEAHLFQYPFFGGLPYRGYFKLEDAKSFATKLRNKALDVHVRPVPAYSTTGWLADPLVTSMFASEVDFIEVLLHELVHVQFYLADEADFNEAFATWFAGRATARFLREASFDEATRRRLLAEFATAQAEDVERNQAVHRTLAQAKAFYASDDFSKTKPRSEEREHLRRKFFESLSQGFAKNPALEKWAQIEWNNAVLVSLSTYHDRVADIEDYAVRNKLSDVELLNKARKDAGAILSELKRLQD